ncbi:acylphosphatase [Methanospirillum sp.]|uniref:acylphosphatase n=1 Tax=Methanospirillum sp. TaxID=45200 RepID=UPI00359F22D8
MKRVSMIVSGRVQGVGFRYYVEDIALGMNISGWVRNLSDGTVEIDAEGEEDKLKNFVRTITNTKKGFIQVSNIVVQDKEVFGYSHFTIRRD